MNEVLNSINYDFQNCIEFIETNKDITAISIGIIVCIIVIILNAVIKDNHNDIYDDED